MDLNSISMPKLLEVGMGLGEMGYHFCPAKELAYKN
jgi:hypothetical protein